MRPAIRAPRRYSARKKIDHTAAHDDPYLYPDVNWTDELMKKMTMRQHANLNVSGGGTKAKYYMALDVQHENGIQNSDKLYSWNNNQQVYNYTFQNNISYKLTSSTKLSMNLNAQIRQASSPNVDSGTLFGKLKTMCDPVCFPVYWPNDAYGNPRYGFADIQQLINLKAELNKTYKQTKYATINAVVKLDQGLDFITKGLKVNAWVNFKSYARNSFTRSIEPFLYAYNGDYTETDGNYNLQLMNPTANQFISESSITHYGTTTFEFQGNLNWARKFGRHDLTAMLMYRMREYFGEKVLPNRNQGLSGRVTYDYGHRYLAEFNFGYNGTERLAKHYRFGFFPAGSLGWVISNEEFWEPLGNTVTHLKLRGSYGLVGSDNLATPGGSYFLYRDQIYNNKLDYLSWSTGDGDNSDSGAGPLIKYYALNDVVWEKSRKLDVGIDMTLWGKLNITGEYFRENRYDIFMQRGSWPSTLGYGVAIPWANVGKALNEGFEVSVNWNHRFSNELAASFQANFTYNHNKFVYNDEPDYDYPWLKLTGRPLDGYRQMGYIAEGLFRSEEDIAESPTSTLGSTMVGDIKYRDLNEDGRIDPDDQTMISEYGKLPRIMYGFGGTVNWKSFDFGVFFTGAACRTISIAGWMNSERNVTTSRCCNVYRWTFENAFNPEKGNFDAEFPLPGLTKTDYSNNVVNSTYHLRNGNYLRLRNAEIGWTFKYGRLYVSGMNLLCFSPFKIWDPELDAPHIYPLSKTVNVGVQFKL